MKKVFTPFLLFALYSVNSIGQVRQPGTPFTLNTAYASAFADSYIPKTSIAGPDLNKLRLEDSATWHTAFDNVRIGAGVPADISFPSAGIITRLDDGRQVWRAQVTVPGGLALGLYYDKFNLPEGVSYYLSNANGKQVLGAYTTANNPDDGIWANEKVQGDLVNLEMDIEPGVDIAKINMHINNIGSFYKSINYLQTYADQTDYTLFVYGTSSACEINAVCPIGSAYPQQRLATVEIEYSVGTSLNKSYYAGTGTMMNNTKQDCTPYILTASHVEPTNSTADATFSDWIFYFNYETADCPNTKTVPGSNQTVTGATFNARASYNSSSNKIVGDFLLLTLKSKVPAAYGAYMAGWDLDTTTPVGTCIGFHHPSGDSKKVSTTTHVYPNGNFNGGQANSHWSVEPWDNGGVEEGSSGSGLFDPNGRLRGDLSGGGFIRPTCTTKNSSGDTMANYSEYSKLALNWDYVFEQPSTAATRLRDWLDPTGSGMTQVDAIAATCYAAGVNQVSNANNTVTVYPSPSTGLIYINGNFNNAGTVQIDVFNIVGSKVLETTTSSSLLNNYPIDLSGKTPGVYLVRVSSGTSVTTRKVLIAK